MSEPFDPKKYLIRVNGNREYLPVAARLIWFRQEHPDWGIITNPVEINLEKQYAIFSCTIMDASGNVRATAHKMENVRGFPDYLEKAETGSVGRGLAACGYGTQFAPDLEDSDGQRQQSGRGGNNGGNQSGGRCTVDGCNNTLNAAQARVSQQKHGKLICLPCQQKGQR